MFGRPTRILSSFDLPTPAGAVLVISNLFTSAFLQNFWESEGFWKGVVVAVLAAVAGKLGHWSWKIIRQILLSRKTFDLAGIWIGECWLPSYGEQKSSIEIWRYSRAVDQVTLSFFAYNSATPEVQKWIGGGVFRGNKLSAYYYELDKSNYESGVIAMEMKGRRLKGVYAQFDPNVTDEPFYVSDNNYEQRRISLPIVPRLKMQMGFAPFGSYREVKDLCEAASR
jgi:hypothetical protein